MKVNLWLSLLGAAILAACSTGNLPVEDLQIIPRPEKAVMGEGVFRLGEDTGLEIPADDRISVPAGFLNAKIEDITGYTLQGGKAGAPLILMALDTAQLSPEAYRLEITAGQVTLVGGDGAGLFYGVQTLGQLLADARFYAAGEKAWHLPALEIEDRPAFGYRGLHLDVSRHFFPKAFVLKCLDLMSQYKMNRFHWHLTDAAGWRIEMQRYPELTERGAWRTREKYLDWWKGSRHYATREAAGAYGGYYTREEIREVVAYAAQRHIMVIPEIEMPGHSEEVVSIYPQLGCYGEPYRNGELCIGKEETFEFVENVLTEVMELFPSEYIHIGGDEASTAAWKKCADCRRRMQAEHLGSEKELQGYMIRRVEKFLRSKGRKLIGWDEILDGGLAPEATVMSWRGERGGIEAAKLGHDVVMTPGGYCYFDSFQADPRTQPAAISGFLPYLKVYSYHPVPAELSAAEARHILGAQGNLWTEYISTPEHAEYMIFPRLLALSEVVWSPRDLRDPEDFKRRIARHIDLLKQKGVNVFMLSDRIDLLTDVDTVRRRIKVSFDSERYRPEIHYILNGGKEEVYREPFYVTDSAVIQAFIVREGKRSAEVSDMRVDCHRAIGKRVSYGHRYSGSYPAAGVATLTDGRCGGLTYGDGCWQGFLSDVEVTVDLDSVSDLGYVSARFMQLTGPGVYMPRYVTVEVSEDGRTFREVARIENTVPSDKRELVIKDFTARFAARGRYVRFFARRQNGFQFVDEVVIY